MKVPSQIKRQPVPQTEAGFPLGAVLPSSGQLHNPVALEESLDGDFEADFKSSATLNTHGTEHFSIVKFECVGCVACRQSPEPMQSDAGPSGKISLQERASHHPSARHVPAGRHQMKPLAV